LKNLTTETKLVEIREKSLSSWKVALSWTRCNFTQNVMEWNHELACSYSYVIIYANKHELNCFRERTEYLDIFLLPPVTQRCSISNVLFTGGMGVSDFCVLKYY